jgi:lipoyl(octanoyl) transferase
MAAGAYLLNLGPTPYREAWELQRSLAAAVSQGAMPETVILLEHPPVVTLGRRAEQRELHLPTDAAVEVVETDRGGKSTYHGPGQLVCYPILDLKQHGQDVKRYVRDLERTIVGTLEAFGIEAGCIEGLTGVWVQPPAVPGASLASGPSGDSASSTAPQGERSQQHEPSAEPGSARREPRASRSGGTPRKIASIGVHVSRWITTHGYALNVELELDPFTHWITACGLDDAQFTSLARELNRSIAVDEVRGPAAAALAEVFALELEEIPADEGPGLWAQPLHAKLAG